MKHIMLVEDEVELAHLVRDYLEAAGFEVSMFMMVRMLTRAFNNVNLI